jgi:hypothetical protein
MRFACCITRATEALRIYNTSCFSTATMVTRTRLNVTFIRIMPVSLTLVLNGGWVASFTTQSLYRWGKTMNAGENNIHEYTGRFKQNVPYYGRKFLKWNYIDNTKNTYIQQRTATKLRPRAKSGLLRVTRKVLEYCVIWTLRKSVLEPIAKRSLAAAGMLCKYVKPTNDYDKTSPTSYYLVNVFISLYAAYGC